MMSALEPRHSHGSWSTVCGTVNISSVTVFACGQKKLALYTYFLLAEVYFHFKFAINALAQIILII